MDGGDGLVMDGGDGVWMDGGDGVVMVTQQCDCTECHRTDTKIV
jgi:hypothetical protein